MAAVKVNRKRTREDVAADLARKCAEAMALRDPCSPAARDAHAEMNRLLDELARVR